MEAVQNPHTKSNLCCKRVASQRAVRAVSLATDRPPSELVVLDLCASDAKDLHGLMMCGVRADHYIGIEGDAETVRAFNASGRPGAGRVYCHDVNFYSTLVPLVRERLAALGRESADLVLCNFALHMLNLDTFFDVLACVTHECSAVQLAIIDGGGVRQLLAHAPAGVEVNAAGGGVARLAWPGWASYEVVDGGPGAFTMRPRILKVGRDGETTGGAFANNGATEPVLCEAEVAAKAAEKGWGVLASLNHCSVMSDAVQVAPALAQFLSMHVSLILWKA